MKLSDVTAIQWVGIIILFNTTLIGGSSQLADLALSAGTVKAILAVATLGNGFLGGLAMMFGGQGSMVRQVAAMPGIDKITVNSQSSHALAQIAVSTTPDAAKVEAMPGAQAAVAQAAKNAAILFAILLGGFLMSSGDAFAQTKTFKPTGDLVKDVKAATTPDQPKLITGNIEKDAHAIWDKIVAASNADLQYASALAGVANTPASLVRKQCYDAILELNTQVNGMNLKDANGNPLPQPDPKLFTGVEQAAETIDNLSPSGKLFTSCAGMAQLTKTNVLTLINAIVTGAAGFAAMPIIPGL